MVSPRINIVENIIGNLSLNIKKLFDKGEIDKLYKQMYSTALSIAARETLDYINKMALKDKEQRFGIGGKNKGKPGFIISKIPDYENGRIQFHLDQMFKLLELYAKSKSVTSQK